MNKNYKRPTGPRLEKSRIIIGRKPIIESLNHGQTLEKIFILKTAVGDDIDEIRAASKKANVAVSFVPMEKLNKFSTANHQGVVAITGLVDYQNLQDIIDLIVTEGGTPLFLIADGITDTRNLGAMARSAVCFNVNAMVVPASNSAAITEDSIKTSAGALVQLPVCRTTSIHEALDTLKLNGFQIVATSVKETTTLEKVDFSIPTAIIMGSEDKGISNYAEKKADYLVKIPMSGKLDSLNVSVATGIVLYEAFKSLQK